MGGRILVTGFEPYGGFSDNPSMRVALFLDGKEICGYVIDAEILPVSFKRAYNVLVNAIERGETPSIIINMGLMPFASAIRVERVAINIMDYSGILDNDGDKPVDEYIVPGGPAAYFSTLPIREIVNTLLENNIPASISNSAGTHLCNYTMYRVLHYISEKEWDTRAGFIHLPLLPKLLSEIPHRPGNTPSLPLNLMIEAVELAIKTTIENLKKT